MRNKILLLGGSGFIGKNLIDALNTNYSLTVYDQRIDETHAFPPDITLMKGDLRSAYEMDNLLKNEKFDIVVYLISGLIPGSSYHEFINSVDLNFTAFFKLLELMQLNQVHKLVYFSSGGTVYGKNGFEVNQEDFPTNPINYYGWTKLTTEHYIKAFAERFGVQYLIVRPSNPYGKCQKLTGAQGLISVILGKLLKKQPIEVWGDGEAIRDYIHISDLCNAVSKLIQTQHWNDTFNVGSGIGVSINEVIKAVQKVVRQEIAVTYLTERVVDIPVNILDISKLKSSIQLDDLIPLEKGIKEYWEELNKENTGNQ